MGQGQSRRRRQTQERQEHDEHIVSTHSHPSSQSSHPSSKSKGLRSNSGSTFPSMIQSSGSSLFDFATLLLSGETRNLFNVVPLPSCWDELLDWTVEATTVTAIIQIHRNDRQEQEQHHHHHLQQHQLPTELEPPCDVLVPAEDDVKKVYRDRPKRQNRTIRFIPFVDILMIEKVEKLPAMSWMERATFYAESVVVAVVKSTDTKSLETLHLLTPIQLSQFYILACRMSELLAVRQLYERPYIDGGTANTKRQENDDTGDCPICFECKRNCALPCGHELCERCEQRCLKQKLACPFCRKTFSSAKQVRKDGWHVTEWSTEAVSNLDHDIAALECQMNEYSWMADATEATSDDVAISEDSESYSSTAQVHLLEGYIQLPRRIQPWIERDGFVFVE